MGLGFRVEAIRRRGAGLELVLGLVFGTVRISVSVSVSVRVRVRFRVRVRVRVVRWQNVKNVR